MDITGDTVTYGFHGVAETEAALLGSMIARLARRLPGPVTQAPAHEAQIVFFEGSAPPLEGPCVRSVRLVRNPGTQQLPDSLPMPPHITNVLAIFTDVLRSEVHAKGQCQVMKSLVRALHDLFQTRGAPHALVGKDGANLILYPADRQFSWSGSPGGQPLSEVFQSHRITGLGLHPLGAEGPQEDRERRGIEPLLWHAGLAHARCGLVPWVGHDPLLKMRVWPYLTGQGPATATRLATLLRARPHTVSALADAAGVGEVEAVAFANAALLCGFVTSAPPAAGEAGSDRPMPIMDAAASRGGRLPGIFGAIRHALGMRA